MMYLGNAALKGSDLLYAFLTSTEEFTQTSALLADLNPWRAMKKMPAKLSRERGQNLHRFLSTLDASTTSQSPSTGMHGRSTVGIVIPAICYFNLSVHLFIRQYSLGQHHF